MIEKLKSKLGIIDRTVEWLLALNPTQQKSKPKVTVNKELFHYRNSFEMAQFVVKHKTFTN